MASESPSRITFDGSNWQDLTRLLTVTQMKFLQSANTDDDEFASDEAKCAYLVSQFTGPALDWAGASYTANNAVFNQYTIFVQGVKDAFGISDQGLEAQRRGELEGLKWHHDLPVFFAEFDRITHQLNLTGNETKIALLRAKLPFNVTKLLAEQALNFHDYSTMRERLLTMWSLDPSASAVGGTGHHAPQSSKKRPRCGRCGRKGHTASECRAKNIH